MYAHKILDNFNKYNLNGIFEDTISYLKMAQKFHFGEIESLMILFDKELKAKTGIFDEYIKNKNVLRMPFSICWFDYIHAKSRTKHGLLVKSIDNNVFYLSKFSCNETIGWGVEPFSAKIDLTDPEGKNFMKIYPTWDHNVQWSEDGHKDMNRNLTLLSFTLKLLNCKNITTETHIPPKALNKARCKKSKQELFTYKTLKLILPKRYQNNPDIVVNTSGRHNRIHLCSGHFKLRKTGLFWWQPQVRGQNHDGIVMKDYNVETRRTSL